MTTQDKDKDPYALVDTALKVFGACSAAAPLIVKTLNILPIRPSLAPWLPWVASGVALVAALVGLFVPEINVRKAASVLASSLFIYVALVVAFPTPPAYDALLRIALVVSYLTIFASFSFLVAHLALKLAQRYAKRE